MTVDRAVPAERIKFVARSALGSVWLYLGLFPKLLRQVRERGCGSRCAGASSVEPLEWSGVDPRRPAQRSP